VTDEKVNGRTSCTARLLLEGSYKTRTFNKGLSFFQFPNVSFTLLCLSPSASSDAYFFVCSYVDLSKSTMNQIQFQTFPSKSPVFAV
jgi:hypothetical protein